ncbi:MAG: DUF3791 domain-containing protein [Prevotella sp.]|nr:DUF3791 domain-containing protein [Prevotella sp.]MBQ6209663.1 DUF3791 domain-containing protein [Prevotella sp.]
MDGKQIILQMKYARLIDGIATHEGITREEAMDRFYHSQTFQMIQLGIADLHCRSDQYLIDEFLLEWNDLHNTKQEKP